jgi:hypothetical protein
MNIYEGFETYKIYIAIRNHFTQKNYDYFKYNGKTRVNADSFLKRKDKFFFAKLERRLSKEELVYFFVANFVNDEQSWSGSLVTEQSMVIYKNWLKKIQSLSYNFKENCQELKKVLDLSGKRFDNLFEANGSHPALLKLYLRKDVSLETMIIIDRVLGYANRWSKELDDDIVWKEVRQLMDKYSAFVKVDTNRYKDILKQTFI